MRQALIEHPGAVPIHTAGRVLCRVWVAALIVATATACGGQLPLIATPTPDPTFEPGSTVAVAAPESFEPALRAVASGYQGVHPEVAVTVLSRADGLALRALHQGEADVAVLTWLPDTLPEGAWVRPVARDGLAIVVNPQNGLPGLTMTQLQDLYQGRLEDWADWAGLPGAPQLISRETAAGAYALFQAWVMRDARVSLNALMAPSSEAVLEFVAEDPYAVGYVSSAWVDGRVRALAVNGVPPGKEAVEAGLYPLTRTHFVVTLGEPDGAVRGLVQWLLAEPGQSLLKAHGWLPPPE